ncbi:MAG: Peptidase, partial [Acidobacteria bacterium]|nr:Peptidase [Acidobacteriota bacterium]
MSDQPAPGLKVVDAFDLDDELRGLLKPGEMVRDQQGRRHRLPRYFYEIPAHDVAVKTRLTPHFGLNEFILVDLKEATRLQQFPRYVPCAVKVLAFYLEQFRGAAGASMHIAVNGAYRSPSHKLSLGATPHMWGTAADIYRVGQTILRTKDAIERYNDLAEDLSDDVHVLPYGHATGSSADDHVHLDLGYVTLVPR